MYSNVYTGITVAKRNGCQYFSEAENYKLNI